MLPSKPVLTLAAAKRIAETAHREAASNGYKLTFAVVDDGANLLYLERMDGALVGSVDVSLGKARTAALYKRPSKAIEDAISNGGRNVLLNLAGVMPLEGGIPLLVDGELVGAIGASGGTAEQDGQAAAAGVAEFKRLLKE